MIPFSERWLTTLDKLSTSEGFAVDPTYRGSEIHIDEMNLLFMRLSQVENQFKSSDLPPNTLNFRYRKIVESYFIVSANIKSSMSSTQAEKALSPITNFNIEVGKDDGKFEVAGTKNVAVTATIDSATLIEGQGEGSSTG